MNKFEQFKYRWMITMLTIAFIAAYKPIKEFFSGFFGIVSPIFIGIVIAILIEPLINKIESKLSIKNKKKKTTIATTLAYLLVVLFIGLLFILVLPALIESVGKAVGLVSNAIPQLKITLESMGLNISENDILSYLFSSKTLESVTSMLQSISPSLVNLSVQFAGNLFNAFLACCIALYISFDKKAVTNAVKIVVNKTIKKNGERIIEICTNTIEALNHYVIGRFIDSLIIGIICAVSMFVLGIPFVSLISLIIGVTNIVPVFGPWVGLIISAPIVLIADPFKALIFTILILVLQTFDGNYLGPKIAGDAIGMPGLLVLCAIIVFGEMFGLAGILLGVPISSVFYFIAKEWATLEENDINEKGAE